MSVPLEKLFAEPSRGARLIVIGASAGAVDALSSILPTLPKDYPIPVAVAVHLPPDRGSVMAELFQAKCAIDVREVEDKEPLRPGAAWFAPPDYHVLVESDGRLSLSADEPVHYSRPAIDVLFESAADAYGPDVVGVILTGANADGARGLRAVQLAGGVAVVQTPDRAYATAMPQAALEACPGAHVLNLDQIAGFLRELTTVR